MSSHVRTRTTESNLLARWTSKVQKGEHCWLWTGARNGKGYGVMKVNQRHRKAYRIAWELAYGPIPDGMDLHHLCETPLCVRPSHLEAVTPSAHRQRHAGRNDTCPHGHPYDQRDSHGRRRCGTCNRLHVAAYRATKRAGV